MYVSRPLEVFRLSGFPLSVYEREQIFGFLVADRSVSWAEIARALTADPATASKRDPTTVGREVNANGGREGYSPSAAEERARLLRARPKLCRRDDPDLEALARPLLVQGWSPWAVAFECTTAGQRVCAETLYTIVNNAAWEGVSAKLCLRSRQPRRPRTARRPAGGAIAKTAPHINDRPVEAHERTATGHFEGDLIIGKGNKSAAITLVDRATGHGNVIALPHGYHADTVAEALSKWASTMHTDMLRTLTWDRGSEMASWQALETQWGVPVFFCDPHSPWQRPVNENFNRQLRWWFPKGTDLSIITQNQADHACNILNSQPRRKNNGQSAEACYTALSGADR
jgi:transposase, IS30 family